MDDYIEIYRIVILIVSLGKWENLREVTHPIQWYCIMEGGLINVLSDVDYIWNERQQMV